MNYNTRPFQHAILCSFCITTLTHAAEPHPSILLAQAAATPASQSPAEAATLNMGRVGGLIFPQVSFTGATVSEVIEFFTVKSRDIDPQKTGVTFLVDEATRALTTRITLNCSNVTLADAIQHLALLARLDVSMVDDAVRLKKSALNRPQVPTRKPSPRIERLSAVVFPSVSFTSATLEEAVEFLRVKCRDLDSAHESMPIIVDTDLVGDKTRKATLDLKNVPLLKALRFISELADVDAICTGDAYYLQPRGK